MRATTPAIARGAGAPWCVRELEIQWGETQVPAPTTRLESPAVAAHLLRTWIGPIGPYEQFLAMPLDARHRPLAIRRISQGTLDATVVHPRDVFAVALLTNAAALVVAHTHPSGDPTPSPEDDAVTERLRAAGAVMGIEVLDHLVLADGGYFSFREAGRLDLGRRS